MRAAASPPWSQRLIAAPELEWQPIATWRGEAASLFRDADQEIFGEIEDGRWFELFDGEIIPVEGFEPTEWAYVPRPFIAQGEG